MDEPKQPDNDSLDLPSFLKRDPVTNKAEYMAMSDTEDLNETKGKARPAKTVKSNSQTKPNLEARKSLKKAKPAKEAKAVKVRTKTVKVETKPEKDQFGLRKGSARSEAAAMYARKSGATLAEVKERVGSVQLNVLTTLANEGWEVEKKMEKHANQRPVTRYWLRAAK